MNEDHQRNQTILRYAVLVIVGVVFILFSAYIVFDYFETKKPKTTYDVRAHLPLDGIDPKEIWVDQIKSENENIQGRVNSIENMFLKQLEEKETRDSATRDQIDRLHQEIAALRVEQQEGHLFQNPNNQAMIEENSRVPVTHQAWNPFSNQEKLEEEGLPILSSVTCAEPKGLHHVNRTIPTGTSVKAILLSSVDMPCGVNGSADPLPVKLRVIADGRLPHHVRSRLKSGIVTASVYGDLSSERVYFRLEKFTQMRKDGYFIETQVAGYVSGEDGKYGLRGVVVDKSAQLVENALFSGFLSGASNFFEAAAAARITPFNGCYPEGCNNISTRQYAGQLAISGGSGGVSNALDVLTDYFIKRAEQLRPVIQITPGRIVDITFSDCADLGDLHTHERVRQLATGGNG